MPGMRLPEFVSSRWLCVRFRRRTAGTRGNTQDALVFERADVAMKRAESGHRSRESRSQSEVGAGAPRPSREDRHRRGQLSAPCSCARHHRTGRTRRRRRTPAVVDRPGPDRFGQSTVGAAAEQGHPRNLPCDSWSMHRASLQQLKWSRVVTDTICLFVTRTWRRIAARPNWG